MPIRLLAIVALLLTSTSALAQLRDYRIDPDHSRVLVKVDHLGLSSTLGMFSGLTGEFRFDDEYWNGARVDVIIPLASLDLGDADWQEKVLDDYLGADKHPEARFEADELLRGDDGGDNGRVRGQLTLNGVTRPVELEVRYNGSAKSLYTRLKRKAGFSASARIQRSEFGLDKQMDLVGDEVRIEIEIEGIEQRR